MADDPLTTTVLAGTAPLVLAPAMHPAMWQNPATQANVSLLRSRGAVFVGPDDGPLTGDDSGPGRLAEPERIAAAVLAAAGRRERSRDLEGLTVLVTAGGTREPLDPVRFIGNRSSGKQGVAIARAALARGAQVTLVAAHLEVPAPGPEEGLRVLRVSTAEELARTAVAEAEGAQLVVMAAAVADFRPSVVQEAKIKKDDTDERLTLELVRNPDVLAALISRRRPGQLLLGFAAETAADRDELIGLGRRKLQRKRADLLALNRVGWSEGFGADENSVLVLGADGEPVAEAAGTKTEVAHALLDALLRLREGEPG